MNQQMNQQMRDCAKICEETFNVCTETRLQCLQTGGSHGNPDHIALLEICADICELSAKALRFAAPQQVYLAEVCARICGECAEQCQSLEGDLMRTCEETCLRCEDACNELSEEMTVKYYDFFRTHVTNIYPTNSSHY
jgi:hypothetical protein